jgi:hypothetical protein
LSIRPGNLKEEAATGQNQCAAVLVACNNQFSTGKLCRHRCFPGFFDE